MGLPPGPSLPVAVQTYRWMFRPVPFMHQLHDRYGECFTIRLAQFGSVVVVTNPDDIRTIFTGPSELLHAGEANKVLEPIVGKNSVLLLDRGDHLRQRRLLLPPFHGERMRRYLEEIDQLANEGIDQWPLGEPFAMREKTQEITLDVILRVIFGISDPARRAAFRDRMTALDPGQFRKIALPALRKDFPGSPWRVFKRRRAALDALLFEEIAARRAMPREERGEDILSMLLDARDEQGEPMTDQELRDELMTLVVAGHETTATSLAWTMHLLYRNPDSMRRLQDEARAGGFELIDSAIKESLRMRPIIPIVARRLTAPMEFRGMQLEAGTVLAPNIYLTHMREDLYPEPKRFKIDRFVEKQPDTYAWLPFGGGIRRCIGASFALYEMRVILQAILRRTELRAAHDKDERIVRRITFSPELDAMTILESREVASGPLSAAA